MEAAAPGSATDTSTHPNPGFKVTGYLKVEYLADGALVQKCNVSNRPTIELAIFDGNGRYLGNGARLDDGDYGTLIGSRGCRTHWYNLR